MHATPAKHLAFSPRVLEVGGRGFQSRHIHQRNSRSPNHLRCFLYGATLEQFRDNPYNRANNRSVGEI